MTNFAADVYEQGLGARTVLRVNVPNPVHSHHQFGTCVNGLFVCDTSIIPSAPFAFPSGTMFVTVRLAVEAILARIHEAGTVRAI
ncbi:MAG: hypothetical protein WDA16_01760 [Candidatus Thermoplasmatota archaeon]